MGVCFQLPIGHKSSICTLNGTGFLTRINVNMCVNVYSANLVAVRKVWNCLSNLKSLLLLSLYGTMVGYLSLGIIKCTFSIFGE